MPLMAASFPTPGINMVAPRSGTISAKNGSRSSHESQYQEKVPSSLASFKSPVRYASSQNSFRPKDEDSSGSKSCCEDDEKMGVGEDRRSRRPPIPDAGIHAHDGNRWHKSANSTGYRLGITRGRQQPMAAYSNYKSAVDQGSGRMRWTALCMRPTVGAWCVVTRGGRDYVRTLFVRIGPQKKQGHARSKWQEF